MGEITLALNAQIASLGFQFEVLESDLDNGWRNITSHDNRKIWFRGMQLSDVLVFWFGDWRTGEKHKITLGAERLDNKGLRVLNKFNKQIEKERAQKALQAKNQIEEVLARWSYFDAENADYLTRKKLGMPIRPARVRHGEEDAQKILVVPMHDETGELWNLQQVYRSGKKTFWPKARTKGLFHLIARGGAGGDSAACVSEPVLLCEGYATGLAAWLATGFDTYVAFSCGNLEAVLRVIVSKHGAQRVVILADWDGATFKRTGLNPGMHASQKLAVKYGVRVAAPVLAGDKNVDFADLGEGLVERLMGQELLTATGLAPMCFKEKREKRETQEVVSGTAVAVACDIGALGVDATLEDSISAASPAAGPAGVSAAVVVNPAPESVIPQYDYTLLSPDLLPDVIRGKRGEVTRVLGTLQNLQVLLSHIQAQVRYNVIRKDEEWQIPGETASTDNQKKVVYARLLDVCARVQMPVSQIDSYLSYIADQNQYNPVKNWLEMRPWDGVSRLRAFLDTVVPVGDPGLRDVLIKRWMLGAIAAAVRPEGVPGTGVLVFQGRQYIGKTKWFKALVPEELGLTADGKILKPDDKDSIKQVICYWLVELGEMDATFRRADVALLKAFLTRDRDMFRAAYARQESSFPRRTAFFGSVNKREFLADETGNRRYWTIECEEVRWDHGLDMQQVWAEVYVAYMRGGDEGRWWLGACEMDRLNESNRAFEVTEPWEEILREYYTFEGLVPGCKVSGRWVRMKDVFPVLEIRTPTKAEANRLGTVLRKLNGDRCKRVNEGVVFWVGEAK